MWFAILAFTFAALLVFSENALMKLETKMMQKIARSTIQAWLLSVAILILGAHYNVAHAAQDNPKKQNCGCLRKGNQKTVQRRAGGRAGGRASASKQRARVFPKESRKTFGKMRCIGDERCAHV
jgi:hypothetical protein